MPVGDRSALLELIAPSVCPACDRPRLPRQTLLCSACAAGLRPLLALRGVRTAIAYEGTGMELIRRFKFDGRRDALAVLLEPLAERAAALQPDLIVPVPRHAQRIREQGSDPVYELARALARRIARPLRADLLRRTRATPPQTGLDPRARRTNVAGSFAAARAVPARARVLLLDDVATTGATLAEAARTLRGAGVRRIVLVALAGTPALASAARSAL